MKKLLGLALALSVLLNAVLLLRKPEPAPPPLVRTRVIEKVIPADPLPAPVGSSSEPVSSSEPRPAPKSDSRPAFEPARPPVPETRATVSLLASPGYASPGEKITVTCSHLGGAMAPQDWIGLYPVGAPVTRYTDFRMVQVTSEYVFIAPKSPGTYEFRYVLADNKTVIASSNPVVVLGNPPVKPMVDLQSGMTYVKAGGEIPADWSLLTGARSTRDWIGLYAAGAKNEDFVSWKYVTDADRGRLTLQAPDKPGTYEIRYLLDNGYESVATSVRIVVLP